MNNLLGNHRVVDYTAVLVGCVS